MRHIIVLAVFLTVLANSNAQNDVIARARQQEMEEQQRRVNARLQALEEALQSIQQEMNALRAELRNQREENNKPAPVSQASVRQLEDRIDRVEKLTLEKFSKIETLIRGGGGAGKATPPAAAPTSTAPKGKSYEYTIRDGDTLSRIVTDLQQQGLKISIKDVERANPKITDWRKVQVGSTIVIPVPEK